MLLHSVTVMFFYRNKVSGLRSADVACHGWIICRQSGGLDWSLSPNPFVQHIMIDLGTGNNNKVRHEHL